MTPPDPPDLRPPRPPAPPPRPAVPPPRLAPWRPIDRRTRWLIVGLTLVTVAAVTVLMLKHQARVLAVKAARQQAGADRPDCPPGAASAAPGCPGAKMDVIVLQPAAVPTGGAR